MLQYSSTEADKGQSQNIYEIRKTAFKIKKNVFKIGKNISNHNVFLEIIIEEFIKSENLLQILTKSLNPQILFCKFQKNLQIQKLLLNPEKYFANPKKYFVTCYLHRQPATVSGLLHPKWRSFVPRVQPCVDQAIVNRLK